MNMTDCKSQIANHRKRLRAICHLSFVICHRQKKKGFTIAEMLVAMGVFLIFSTVALGIYASTIKAQRKTVALSRIQREAQYLMEFIAKQIRTSTVDYAAYGGTVTNPATALRLRDQKNQTILLNYDGTAKTVTITVAGGPARTLSSNTITVNSMNFYIIPTTSPFPGGGAAPAGQPRVSVVLDLQGALANQSGDIILQQTVPQQSVEF